MRVISGERRGFRLKTPKNRDIRPTEDRIKETVFNIISPIRHGTMVIDCFSGTGSIGIEFLSRGASYVYFVDNAKEAVDLIRENIEHTKYLEHSEVIFGDFLHVISRLKQRGIEPAYIYLDPPFKNIQLLREALEIIDNLSICRENCLIIVESDHTFEDDTIYRSFSLVDRRNYKTKSISFYRGGVLE